MLRVLLNQREKRESPYPWTPAELEGKPPFESYPFLLPAQSSLLGVDMDFDLNKIIIKMAIM